MVLHNYHMFALHWCGATLDGAKDKLVHEVNPVLLTVMHKKSYLIDKDPNKM